MSEPSSLPEHVQRNRVEWDAKADEYAAWAPRAWAQSEPSWGQLNVPDAAIGALPPSVDGLDVIDLGCGTGYFSAWLARRGAQPVGIDNSPRQLETARQMQVRFGIDFPLHLGSAEELPFPDASFDLAISEYGASIWCDPYRWIPEAARVLRPGGQLVFLVNGVLVMLCSAPEDSETTPVSECFRRPYFGMHRFEWDDDDSVEFHLNHGDMIRLLRSSGFDIEDLVELQAPPVTGKSEPLIPYVPDDWARKWPAEEIWRVRKRGV
ncbi:MAG: Malonyl-[acyl-carrier protein] O-methyltransferase [uncultured Thermomicrobiales bacterium]|uniref:Malonyl-[acyl-carrier protein] O-methyltransferase n=1 Tax=uncultured Thermomicrobiales bacterium TaxID=1645740 RepID=A0A6J4UHH7_9BACT|nr:MAG: Malonyl-[acyl-carrier protein] O-methyltransferase [uncultured Thermomicrobiales bacterium]